MEAFTPIPKIRAGNKFTLVWAIERDGVAEDLTDINITDLQLTVCVGGLCAERVDVPFTIVDTNKVRSQHLYERTGLYNLELTYKKSGVENEIDIDAFRIVARSAEASDSTEFAVSSDMAIAFKGDTGNGIQSITLTATVGKVKTYTITFTDLTTTTFTVTDGADGHSPVITFVGTTIYVDGVAGPDLKGEMGQPTGVVEEGNTEAVSGGEVFKNAMTNNISLFINNNNNEELTGSAFIELERGNLSSTGVPATSSTNLRSTSFKSIPENGYFVEIKNISTLRIRVQFYDANDASLGNLIIATSGNILKSSYANAEKFKLVVYKNDSSIVNQNDIKNNVYIYDASKFKNKLNNAEENAIINKNNIEILTGIEDLKLERGNLSSSGVPVTSTERLRTKDFLDIPTNGVKVSIDDGSFLRIRVYYYNSADVYLGDEIKTGSFNITREQFSGAEKYKVLFYYSSGDKVELNDLKENNIVFTKNLKASNKIAYSNIRGKRILWLGTSIPAGSSSVIVGGSIRNAYPHIIADRYNCVVYNEAIPTSAVKRGRFSQKTESDPFGMIGMSWNRLSLGMSWKASEAQDLIDNWSTWQPLLNSAPTTLTQDDKDKFLSACHDNIFAKYWGENATNEKPDIVIIDHGRNDFIPSPNNDSGENVNEIPADRFDRTTAVGALNFIVNEILQRDNKVKILIVGHYDDHESLRLVEAQSTFANYWKFPFLKSWEKSGFTLNEVNTDGYWSGSGSTLTWVDHGNPSGFRNLAMINIWLPDGVHPGNDASGKANYHLSDIIGKFIDNN